MDRSTEYAESVVDVILDSLGKLVTNDRKAARDYFIREITVAYQKGNADATRLETKDEHTDYKV
jgi:hypothetical protein